MLRIPRWKLILILGVVALAFLYALPNALPGPVREKLPSWLPSQTVNLGLDLQGGSHILLEVDVSSVLKERADDLVQTVRPSLREQKVGYTRISAIDGGLRMTLRDAADADKVRKIIRDIDPALVVTAEGTTLDAVLPETAVSDIYKQTIEQSIEIVRRRVDETGTNEPIIQRQGEERILVQLPGVEDPERVKTLLGRTAKLSFHLVDMDVASNLREGGGTMTLPLLEAPGQTMAVQRRAMITGDMLVTAAYSQDQGGQPAVSFRLNTTGAKRFCDVSRANVNRLFAIVLDNEIISAPSIREPICGGSGQISGSFSLKEANDLALLLRAGALPAPLTILEERSVGPSLGADSIEAGRMACLIGLVLILGFISIYYSLFGIFANIALFVNMALIFAMMSGLQATLTLPGIAGLLLTLAMAVDSNVLIFERIREELRAGRSAMSAIDAGYTRAMTTIIDSNLTTLIAAVILYSFGTGPIKGFAVTLGFGIIASFFSAIPFSRMLVVFWLGRRSKMTGLPV